MDGQKIWSNILSAVRDQVSSSTFKTWFAGASFVEFKNDNGKSILKIAVKNNFIKEQLERKYLSIILACAKDKGVKDAKLLFDVIPVNKGDKSVESTPLFSGVAPSYLNGLRKIESLNPNHNFENFVIGPSNNLAYLAFQQAALNVGSLYNPLFVYGPTGVGKTHLLQAFGNEILAKYQDARVLYVPCERFTNDYLEALNNRTIGAFRQKYRSVDVLLADDVQFLAGKESTQNEFFYTFNEIFMAGRQLVLAADHHPKELVRVKDRLSSRFMGGMTVDIGMPDLELRVAILRAKCKEKAVAVSDEVLDLIAQSCEGGVRELEGMLISVLSTIKLTPNIDSSEIQRLVERAKPQEQVRPSPGKIIQVVSRFFKVPTNELSGPGRKASIVHARQIVMFLLRLDVGLPLESIGQLVGGRDHSTVLYGIEKVHRQLAFNQKQKDDLARIRANYS